MTTEAQIAANRANAKLSTGPRTPEGKAIVALNAFKHGLTASTDTLLPNESPEDFQALADGLFQSLKPRDSFELLLVQRIIQSAWRLARAEKFENHILARFCASQKLDKDPELFYYGLRDLMDWGYDQKLHRRQSAIERSLYQAQRALNKYRKAGIKMDKTKPISPPVTSSTSTLCA